MSALRLSALLNLSVLQNMADSHFLTSGMPIGIIDAIDGSILVGAGWQDICVKFHRSHPDTLSNCQESDNCIKDHLQQGEAYQYKCQNGLWDIGIPIIVAGKHLATLFLGQFFYEDEAPDIHFFTQQAHRYSFNIDDYLSALAKVPIFSHEKVTYILEYDKALAILITDLAEHALAKITWEREHKNRLRSLECMELINQAIKQDVDVDTMLQHIVQTVFTLFDCDRAWLLYPCNPLAPSFSVPIEICRPEYPGANTLKVAVPMTREVAKDLEDVLQSKDPLIEILGHDRPVNPLTAEKFGVKSQMFQAISPKLGEPWVIGMHQCSYPRVWSEDEKVLFKEIGHRMADALSSTLLLHDLRESEERFRTLANSGLALIWTSGPDKLCDYFNEPWLRYTGRTLKQELGNGWTEGVHPQDFDRCLNIYVSHFDRREPFSMEYRLRKANGEYGWLLDVGNPRHDSEGHFLGYIGFCYDITDRRRSEEEKKMLNAQLQQAQKLEAIGTLAGGIAHDFNNILGAIVGYSEMIREDFPADSPGIHDIDQVIKASYRAKDLVKQILAFSRRVEDQKIPMQPAGIVKEAINLLRSSLPTTIAITQDIDADVGMVLADPTQIHQIVMNLATNAFHAMEMGGGTLAISLQKKILCQDDLATEPNLQPGAFVQLSIKDTGEGIPPEIREKIFDPFFTTKEVGKGTGLGLSMVYSIVKGCHGAISCDSRLGEGTEFRILLPALEVHTMKKEEATNVIPLGKEHILLIDDEETLVELGQTILQRLGYQVTARRNSLDALKTFQNQPDAFDLIITDQTMPGMTGVDLARRILQIRPQMPIILCTGYSSQITEDQVKAVGIKGFASKPLTKKDIGNLIRKVLDGKQP